MDEWTQTEDLMTGGLAGLKGRYTHKTASANFLKKQVVMGKRQLFTRVQDDIRWH